VICKKDLVAILNVAISALALFVIVPVSLIGQAPQSFKFIDAGTFFRQAGVGSGLSTIALVGLYVLIRFLKLRGLALYFSIFLVMWISLSGFLIPVIESSAMRTAVSTSINHTNLAIVLSSSIVVALLYSTRLYVLPSIFALVLAITSFTATFPTFLTAHADTQSRPSGWQDFSTLSKDNNIIVLSFDGIPGNVARDVLQDHPSLVKAFKDFKFFGNVIAAAPATSASIRAELFGVRSFREIGGTDAQVNSNLDMRELTINRLDNVYTYGNYSTFNLNPATQFWRGLSPYLKTFEHRHWRNLVLSRVTTSYGFRVLRKLKLIALLDGIDDSLLGTSERDDFDSLFANYAGPSWKVGHLYDARNYKDFLSALNPGGTGTAIRMLHFTHTHFPVDFDKECAFRSDNKIWRESNQNYAGRYNQTICELTQFAEFLRRLREMNIYDNSLVVLKSDHGEPAYYFSEYPHNLRINGHPSWGYNRYLPLLMIKPRARTAEKVDYASGPFLTSLADLAKTLCAQTEPKSTRCNQFHGIDLLENVEIAARDSEHLYLDVVRDSSSSFRYEDHVTVQINRRSESLFDALRNIDGVELTDRNVTTCSGSMSYSARRDNSAVCGPQSQSSQRLQRGQ
jgi:hypothetical protein